MILPGHIAASLLCHRYLKVDLTAALVAGLAPDVVDKLLYYGLRLTPNGRVPMHTLWAWLLSTGLVVLAGWLWRRQHWARQHWRRWPVAWFVAYGAHLFCDSPLLGGRLPFLWPLLPYEAYGSPQAPLGFLFGLDAWPVATLLAEAGLVLYTVFLYRRRAVAWMRRLARGRLSGSRALRWNDIPRGAGLAGGTGWTYNGRRQVSR